MHRRLASGELSAEEEAEARARLAAIAAERDELKLQFEEIGYNSRLAGYDAAVRGLDSEEAELRRRLAAGEVRITTTDGQKVTAQAEDGFLSVDNNQVTIVAGLAEITS